MISYTLSICLDMDLPKYPKRSGEVGTNDRRLFARPRAFEARSSRRDSRHPPTADDQAMYEWLQHFEIPTLVVATKIG